MFSADFVKQRLEQKKNAIKFAIKTKEIIVDDIEMGKEIIERFGQLNINYEFNWLVKGRRTISKTALCFVTIWSN